MPLLEVKNLSVHFRAESGLMPAVSDVSFSLEQGEMLALVGESGCGKSVTCMSLARLVPEPPAVLSGQVLINRGKDGMTDILSLSSRELRRIRGGVISYIFQEPSVSLNPVFRIGAQIAEAVRLHRPDVADPDAEAVDLLRQVGIPDPVNRARQYPHEMSGGMQQRVMIAMALGCNPSILIADEPTTALDVTIQAQILDLLLQLKKSRNMSIILVTHNLGIVAELADRVAVMYAGRIVETAPVDQLMKHPAHPYTQALIRAVPTLGGAHTKLNTIRGTVPSPDHFGKGCRFFGRCVEADSHSRDEQHLCEFEVPEFHCVAAGHQCACHFTKTSD